jgi:hypothetical protein
MVSVASRFPQGFATILLPRAASFYMMKAKIPSQPIVATNQAPLVCFKFRELLLLSHFEAAFYWPLSLHTLSCFLIRYHN